MIQCVSWAEFTLAWEYRPALSQTCCKERCKTPSLIFIANYGRTEGRQRLHWMSFLLLMCQFNPLLASWKMCWKLSLCLKYSWTNTRDTIAHFCQETLLSAAKYFALVMKNEQLMYRWEFSIANIGAVKNISKVLCACTDQGTWLSWLGERVAALKTDCFCPGFK